MARRFVLWFWNSIFIIYYIYSSNCAPVMNENQERVLSATRNYVTELFTHTVKPEFVFHNLEHTEDVADGCSRMADHYHLSDEDRFVLMLAAWFHDTGYY